VRAACTVAVTAPARAEDQGQPSMSGVLADTAHRPLLA
jgi:hypothetical protein